MSSHPSYENGKNEIRVVAHTRHNNETQTIKGNIFYCFSLASIITRLLQENKEEITLEIEKTAKFHEGICRMRFNVDQGPSLTFLIHDLRR